MELPPGIELVPCDPDADGPFIRDLTRANFFELFERTIGWDETKAREQPAPPRVYRMVHRDGKCIGFVATMEEDAFRYLVTIQLVPEARGQGLGTALMHGLEAEAAQDGRAGVRLRVFDENRARGLYDRLGYEPIGYDAWSHTLEKRFGDVDGA